MAPRGRPPRLGWLCFDKVQECPQWRRHQAASGIVEKRPWKRCPPIRQDGNEAAAPEVRVKPFFEQRYDPDASNRHVDRKVHRAADAHGERALWFDADEIPFTPEFPRTHERTISEAPAQASMLEKVSRMSRRAAPGQIGWGSGNRQTLDARPDRHRDHVLLQPLI